ncbi:hypothetical protein [uncultured Enterovirga sp.]|uniref:hypothetical protein n=1 Tax=uncultured Enterovirga sp. TaxID=2026352 RepID=UPI0035CB04CE
MIHTILPRGFGAAAATLLYGGTAIAQAVPPAVDCGAKAALYAPPGKGPKVWVVRRGEMARENPLRPLTPERLVVLQVVVNGRLATAYGPDYDNLQQGGAPRDLERDAADPIRWQPGADGLPPTFRVVAQDGAVLFAGMRFAECVEPPKSRVAAPAPRRADPDRPDRKAAEERSKPQPGLPQGAMDGLSLPGRGTN